MSNLHVNLDEANKHDPKGFIPAPNNTYPAKTELGVSYYEERMQLPKAINFVDGTAAPPTTADYDVYVITGSGTEDAGWGSAVFNDWVRFLNGIPTAITPLAGYRAFDVTAGIWKEFNGTNWVAGDANTTNLSVGTITATTLDVNSDTGTNATLPSATGSDAGLMSAAKFNEVVANNSKVSNATHTSEVTGSTALTLDKTAISNKTLVTADGADHVLIGDASDADNLKKVLVSDFLGGGGNLGDTNLTLSGATVRTYNVDGNELRFIDGANTLLKVHPDSIVAGGATPDANIMFIARGTTNSALQKSLRAQSLAGTSFFEVDNTGNARLESATEHTKLVLQSNPTNKRSEIVLQSNTGAVAFITGYGSGGGTFLQNSFVLQGGSLTKDVIFMSYSNDMKWHLGNVYTDAGVDMRLTSTGLLIGDGIGASSASQKLHVKGGFLIESTASDKIIESNNVAGGSLGLFGATPISQPTTGVASATIVNGSGTNALQDDTFDGYTMAQVVKALINLGILA
jgi:hypothetical protein